MKALLLLSCCGTLLAAEHPTGSDSWQIHPALEMKLFAKEPDVVDPVSLCFDEDGRIYVVEMRDYPLGIGPEKEPGGTIRLLEDLDGDGKIDRSTVFADNLRFPTSIVPWKGGVFVSAPPEIIYLKDTNGDGKADIRTVWFEGFVLGVTDSNVNGLQWALDNRIHGANGGNGGDIRIPRSSRAAIPIRGLDFSFDPQSKVFQATTQTSGGFELAFDDWGRSFTTYNINHIQQRIVPARYLAGNSALPPVDTTRSISDHEEMSRIYPISVAETRVNHPEQAGHFSAAGGIAFLTGYPGGLTNCTLVCDVVGNLVHRDRLVPDGAIFKATRAPEEERKEFFASRDNAFRPVGIFPGPDGALYLVDMQRDVIEHPDYIPEKVKAKLDLRAGEDRGRIYRIAPKGGFPAIRPALSKAPGADLLGLLGSSNRWQRLTAQRLLIERGERGVAAELGSLVRNPTNAFARLHALWTLEGLGSLKPEHLLIALKDPEPGVRENALILTERHPTAELRRELNALLADPEPRVRFQALLTAGLLQPPGFETQLPASLKRDLTDRWQRFACLTALRANVSWASLLLTEGPKEARAEWARELADVAGASPASGRAWSALLTRAAGDAELLKAALTGLAEGLGRSAHPLPPAADPQLVEVLRAAAQSGSDEILEKTWALEEALKIAQSEDKQRLIKEAAQKALEAALPAERRAAKTRLLAHGEFGAVRPALFQSLQATAPAEVQRAALDALKRFKDPAIAEELTRAWGEMSPATRQGALALILENASYHGALLKALEEQRITAGELNLDLEQRRTLLRESTPDIQKRAAKIFGDEEYANRKTVVADWLGKLPKTGDPAAGKEVFIKNCAVCHAAGSLGHHTGPDLSDVSHRSIEDLLSNILDPNMALNPAFITYQVDLDNDETESGILKTETPSTIVLVQAEDKKVTIPRSKIRRMKASGLSLMPEGFETVLTPQQMRDLLEFMIGPHP